MKFLQNMTPDGTPGSDTLTYALHKVLARKDPARPLGITHASDVTKDDWCPRRVALLLQHNVEAEGTWATAVDRLVWALGLAAGDAIAHWMADADLAIGNWKCRACGETVNFSTRPGGCGECGGTVWDYVEVRFRSEQSGISGAIDLLWRHPTRKLRIVEVKSIKQDQFQALKAPIAEHKLRTNLYMRCVKESRHQWRNTVDTERATVIYVTKQGWGVKDPTIQAMGFGEKPFAPFKEFEVERDDSQTDVLVEKAQRLEIWKAHQSPVTIPSGVCPNALCPKAQRCEVSKQCFSA
jgi:Holliday junction resolvase-like predicted endonuclease